MQLLDRQRAWGAVGAGIETGVMFQKSLALASLGPSQPQLRR